MPLPLSATSSKGKRDGRLGFTVSAQQVLKQLQSFSKGSACGKSGWRVTHYIQLFSVHRFSVAFTSLINTFLSGVCDPAISAQLYVQGNLIPLLKKDADVRNIRPIVVGEVFRRLISKLCTKEIAKKASDFLQPFQLGVGVPNGIEAILHAFNKLIKSDSLDPSLVLLLIDFVNAFNMVNRNSFLTIVRESFPAIFPWVYYCYSVSAPLFLDSFIIWAQTGVQQGDPLVPSFSLSYFDTTSNSYIYDSTSLFG